jgi:hypothetical protein
MSTVSTGHCTEITVTLGHDRWCQPGRYGRCNWKYGLRVLTVPLANLVFPRVTYLFRTTGQVLGVSLSGTILQAVLVRKLQQRIRGPGAAKVGTAKLPVSFFLIDSADPRPSMRFGNPVPSCFEPRVLTAVTYISHSTAIIPTLDPALKQATMDSYADALRMVFICQAALNVIGLGACITIQENPLSYVLLTSCMALARRMCSLELRTNTSITRTWSPV